MSADKIKAALLISGINAPLDLCQALWTSLDEPDLFDDYPDDFNGLDTADRELIMDFYAQQMGEHQWPAAYPEFTKLLFFKKVADAGHIVDQGKVREIEEALDKTKAKYFQRTEEIWIKTFGPDKPMIMTDDYLIFLMTLLDSKPD